MRVFSAVAGLTAGAIVLASAAGCGQVDATLRMQWANVGVRHGTPPAAIAQIAARCQHLPGVSLRTVHGPRHRVTGITLHPGRAGQFTRPALREIYSCFSQFPAVTGVSIRPVNP